MIAERLLEFMQNKKVTIPKKITLYDVLEASSVKLITKEKKVLTYEQGVFFSNGNHQFRLTVGNSLIYFTEFREAYKFLRKYNIRKGIVLSTDIRTA